ncbi:MAG: formate--tetrahydrofolate ligase, partial [Aestuariivirgaceae bacterium]
MVTVKSDIEIARQAVMKPVIEIGSRLGIPEKSLIPFGHTKAKVHLDYIAGLKDRAQGKLILVTAINPTPAGEGKTTTTVGLGDGLNAIGRKAIICLREPSLGPCFGMKGGAAGGGYAQIVPMEDINLHFTGDFHAITSAHNLLAAIIDNHLYWGNELGIDSRRVSWRRVIDMNDRALREIVCSLGGVANGYPREAGFDITVASEIMAILCLATSISDLERRLGQIVVAARRDRGQVFAKDLKAPGAMTVLLKDALMPNLVQTLENNPAFVHGGPFANIAHGCNSVMATTSALSLADYVVTEAGFGADLGAEKFFDIKCRKAGLDPAVAVIVATVRALKMHGGVVKDDLRKENVPALRKGLANLGRHIENMKKFGVPITVAVNHFMTDTEAEIDVVKDYCREHHVEAFKCTHWAHGSKGAEALARHVAGLADKGTGQFTPIYGDDMPLWDKIKTIAREIYRAEDIVADKTVRDQLRSFEALGYGKFPIC